jgi:hypothetical protein
MEEFLLAWFSQNGRDLPWRKTTDPYAILVSEVMLRQTQVSAMCGKDCPQIASFLPEQTPCDRPESTRLAVHVFARCSHMCEG